MIGIISYGTYIPTFRLPVSEIANAWHKEPREIEKALGVKEKAVPSYDEDAVTIAIEAAFSLYAQSDEKPEDTEVLLVGSESHPYAVNPTATIVGELLGFSHQYLASDMQFACKAGTAAMQAIAGLVAAGHARTGLAIGADTAQSKPHDVLEYASAAGGAAYLLGRENLVAELFADTSYSSDTPDFWRRDGIRYPSHAGRFTGEPAYFTHVMGAANQLLSMSSLAPEDFDHCVFHMPNGKFPRDVAKRLGFTDAQIAASLTVEAIGNSYSATALLGLAAVLDIAKPNQKIFVVSYGSGAGSDGFIFRTTDALPAFQQKRQRSKSLVSDHIAHRTPIDYLTYLQKTHKI
jgi:hydroxymethylglutaryl-CoA synthase